MSDTTETLPKGMTIERLKEVAAMVEDGLHDVPGLIARLTEAGTKPKLTKDGKLPVDKEGRQVLTLCGLTVEVMGTQTWQTFSVWAQKARRHALRAGHPAPKPANS